MDADTLETLVDGLTIGEALGEATVDAMATLVAAALLPGHVSALDTVAAAHHLADLLDVDALKSPGSQGVLFTLAAPASRNKH